MTAVMSGRHVGYQRQQPTGPARHVGRCMSALRVSDTAAWCVGSTSAVDKPWYRENDTDERNEAARRGYEAMLIVTLRHPDSPQYEQFAGRVRQRALREYGYDVYGDEVRQSIDQYRFLHCT